MPKTIQWEGTGERLPSGHTIIQTHDDGHGQAAWAIFDRSGRTPETTDDGILWLDFGRTIKAGARHLATVPVIDVNGDRFTVPVDTPTVLKLARDFKWTVEDDVRGHFYTVR